MGYIREFMAPKNNLYAALEYVVQMKETAKPHRKKMKRKRNRGQ